MYLLVVSIHREELLDEVLSLLVELELPDAIVVESRSGLELLERDLPIFAGLRALIPGGIDFVRLLLCVVDREEVARDCLARLEALEPSPLRAGEPRSMALLIPVAERILF